MGKLNVVERELKDFFNEWELGICMLLSLFLQTLLILAAPLRRIVSRKWLDIPLWLAYLLADGIAIFAVGLISSKQIYYYNRNFNAPPNNILYTFWAPFLLVHLGGPDPITAFALEDNELWLRHLFNFFTQCVVVAYVFYQCLTPNKLLAPSLLIYLCGIIKYAERTYALYCASANTFRDSILKEPDPDSAKFMREYISQNAAQLPDRSEMFLKPDGVTQVVDRIIEASEALDLKPLEVLQYAFRYFTHFKGLIVDLIFSFNQRNQSREFFLKRSFNDAFRIVEVELNFLYDVLFTKVPVVYCRVGFGCRAVSIGAFVTSLTLFHYANKKHFKPHGFEVEITYTLLIGGIVLEVIAFLMLVFSDWTIVKLGPSPDENLNEQSWKRMFLDFIVSANIRKGKIICWLLNLGSVRGTGKDYSSDSRWAETISGYNFIEYCLHRRSETKEKIYDQSGIRGFLDGMVYVRQHPLPSYMKDFIFEELKMKSEMASLESVREICSAKGEWVLRNAGHSEFFSYVADVDYDESLLLWHIATEVCYNNREDEIILYEQDHLSEAPKHHRRIAKLISDYMIYLLVMKPGMMSAVSRVGLIRFRLTCAAATEFFDRTALMSSSMMTIYEHFISRHPESMSVALNEDRSRAILYKAARLARDLKEIEFKERWEIMSKVWVELLSYGACHIKTNAHAQQLSKGGELITVVWLLMTHLGLGDQFQVGVRKTAKPESPPHLLRSKGVLKMNYNFDEQI